MTKTLEARWEMPLTSKKIVHQEDVVFAAPGPWGRIEVAPLSVRPTQEFADHYRRMLGLDSRTWNFPHLNFETLAFLLQALGFRLEIIDKIVRSAFENQQRKGLLVRPSNELLTEISASERAELYRWLGHVDPTCLAASPFRHQGTFVSWFADSPLELSTIDLLRPLVYQQGEYVLFADLPLIAERVQDNAEFGRLIKTLACEKTVRAKLHVSNEDSLDELVAYWSRGRSENEVRSLLKSRACSKREQTIDIVQLLPEFARTRLNTYLVCGNETQLVHVDGEWDSLNFFGRAADESMTNSKQAAEVIRTDWQPISSPPMLGDLMVLQNPRDANFRTAIFVADNILFAKSGPAVTRPWVLMRERDFIGFDPRSAEGRMQYYRRKDLL